MTQVKQKSTWELGSRLEQIRKDAGDAWGPGFVNEEASEIIQELESRDTTDAHDFLEYADELYGC